MSSANNSNHIISIDGNIGSGKSTIISHMKNSGFVEKFSNIIILDEPIVEWATIQDEHGIDILSNFYNDQNTYAFSFQIVALSTRIAIMKKAIQQNSNCIIITERTLETDRYVFAQMLHSSGKIDTIHFNIYKHMYETFVSDYPTSKLIYINTCPTICAHRINLRNRNGESLIDLNYLNQCDEYHSRLVKRMKEQNVDVLEIDGNNDVAQYPNYLCATEFAIHTFLLDLNKLSVETSTLFIFQAILNNQPSEKISKLVSNTNVHMVLNSSDMLGELIRAFDDELKRDNSKELNEIIKQALRLLIKRFEEIQQIVFETLQIYAQNTVLCGNY